MSFDAGAIYSTLDLDRSPFQAGLAAAREDARRFADEKITPKVDLDTTKADAEIKKLRAELALLDRKVKLDVDTGTSVAKVKEVKTELALLAEQAQKTAEESKASFNPMISAIAGIGPALIPLAGGLGGLSLGMVGLGAAGMLAFKGISDNMARNTTLGGNFQSVLVGLKGDLSALQDSAAGGFFAGFAQSLDKINADMPQLNTEMGQLGTIVGDVLSHAVGTVVSLFTTFEPLILKAAGYVDQFFGAMEHWAQSSSATTFMNALSTDMDLTVKFLEQLLPLIGTVFAAFNGPGQVVLTMLTEVSAAINAIPLPVLTAVAVGVTAWGIASLITPLITGAAAAVLKLAAANEKAGAAALAASGEEDVLAASIARASAAAASTGLAGASAGAAAAGEGSIAASAASAGLLSRGLTGVGVGLSAIASKAIPIIGLAIGLNTAANATKSWQDSTSGLQRVTGETLDTMKKLVTLDWTGILPNLHGHNAVAAQAQATQSMLNDMAPPNFSASGMGSGVFAGAQAAATSAFNASPGGGFKSQADVYALDTQMIAKYAAQYTVSMAQVNEANNAAAISNVQASGSLASIGTAYGAYDKMLNDNIASEKQWTDVTGNKTKIIDGTTYSQKAWNEALAQANGDTTKAQGILEGHTAALALDQTALADSAAQQANLNKLLADGQGQWNLSATQVSVLSNALGINLDLVAKSTEYEKAASDEMGVYADKILNGNIAMQGWVTAIGNVNYAQDTLSQKVAVFGAGLTAIRGDTLTLADANLQAVDGMEKLTGIIEANSKSIGTHGQLLGQDVLVNGKWMVQQPQLTAGSMAITKEMVKTSDAAIAMAQSIYQSSGSADTAWHAYDALKQQFIQTQTQILGSKTKAQGLADTMFGSSKTAQEFADKLNGPLATAISGLTAALLGVSTNFGNMVLALSIKDGASPILSTISSTLDTLTGKTYTINVETNQQTGQFYVANPGGSSTAPNLGPHPKSTAKGSIITAGSGPTADDVPLWVSRGEAVIPADQVSKHYAIVNGLIQKSGMFAASGYMPSFDVGTVAAKDGGSTAARSASGTSATSAQFIALEKALNSAMNSVANFGTATAASIASSMNSIVASVQTAMSYHAGGSSALVNDLRTENTELAREVAIRDSNAKNLAAINAQITATQNSMNSLQASVANTIMGGFNIATSGSGYAGGIQASLANAVADATKFQGLLAQAKAEGYSMTLIEQLAAAGPQQGGKNLEALVAAGKASASYVATINSQYGQLSSTAQAIGAFDAQATFGAQLVQETATQTHYQQIAILVNRGMAADIGEIKADIAKLDAQLVAAQRRG